MKRRRVSTGIPKHIPIEVGRYALDHGIKDTLEKFSKQHPKFTFKRTSVNLWKTLLKKSGDNQTFNKKCRPNFLSETSERRRMSSLAHALQAL